MENDFGAHSLTQILQNIQNLVNQLFHSHTNVHSSKLDTPIQKNHGLEILLYMLQNTNTMLGNIMKKTPPEGNLMNNASGTVKKVTQTLSVLKDYFTPDLEEPDESEERLKEPEESGDRIENLGFGMDSTDYFKGEDVTIISKGVQKMKDGKVELPTDDDITEETHIRLLRGESKDNVPKYEFVVDEKNTPKKVMKLSANNSGANITSEK
jgi:hypothetical protein